MKQQTNSIVWVLALVGFAAASWVANNIYNWKVELSPYQAQVPTQFYAGMDKFLSNISWMTLIQWQSDDARMKSAESPEKLYTKLNALTNLDPLFADAYLDGALTLASSNPQQAVRLLDKAIMMGLNSNWKVPFYAGQISMMNIKDVDKALPYFEMANKAPDVPDYVQSSVLHAKCAQLQDEPVASMKVWYDYYGTLAGPDQAARRQMVAMQISEYADAAKADLDKKIQGETDNAKRDELKKNRDDVARMVKDVGSAAPIMSPATTQPAI